MADSVADLPARRGEGAVAHREQGPDRARPGPGAPYGDARPGQPGPVRNGADGRRPPHNGLDRNGTDRAGSPPEAPDRTASGATPTGRPWAARSPAGAETPGRHKARVGPTPWLVLSIVVTVLAFGLLSLRSIGLDLLGGRGLAAVFVLGEALGIGGIVFVSRSMTIADSNPDEAAEALATGRRWVLSGLAFVVGMGLIALGAQFLPTAMTS